MVVTSPRLSALVLLAIPVIVLPLVVSGRAVRRRSRAAQDRLADASAYAAEAIGAMRIMQAFGVEQDDGRPLRRRRRGGLRGRPPVHHDARSFLTGVAIFLVSASVVGVLWYGAQDVLAGTMTAGPAVAVRALRGVRRELARPALGGLGRGRAGGGRGRAARRDPRRRARHPGASAPACRCRSRRSARSSFEDVCFAYPTQRRAARRSTGLTFAVAPGERVALVGPSGAGQEHRPAACSCASTIRRRAGSSSTASRSRRPIRWRCGRAWPSCRRTRRCSARASRDNIRYGRHDATDEEIDHAATLAAADGFIRALPQGYDTLIGERGVTLSGGQRQRLAIARAILKDAPILLLDEATSALDAESERKVQTALDRLMEGRTTLVIAHRLATIRSADRILVMDQGRIVEEGTHEALLAEGGLYARLARLQFTDPDGEVQAAE